MVIINPVPLPPFGGHAYTNITPFTYRDGWTFQRVIEELRKYIRDVLVPHMDAGFTDAENYVNNTVAELITFVENAIDETETWTTDQIAALTTYVNNQVQLIINDSIQVQDPVVAGIFGDPVSDTRVVTDTLYAKFETETTVETGRLSNSELVKRFGRGVSVKDHGAIGDGLTDDSAAIRLAIAALPATGGVVWFPSGSYVISREDITKAYCVTIPANVSLVGENAELVLAAGQPDYTSMINVATSGVSIRGLKLNGNKANQSNEADHRRHGIYVDGADIAIESTTIKDIAGDGILLYHGAKNCIIDNCRISTAKRSGIAIVGAADNTKITSCVIVDTTGTPIDGEVEGVVCKNVIISGNHLKANPGEYGLTLSSTTTYNEGWIVDGNTIIGGVLLDHQKMGRITNNVIITTAGTIAAITANRSADCLVSGNIINAFAKAVQAVYTLATSVTGLIVVDNTITSIGNAINLDGISSCIISRNRITGNDTGDAIIIGATANASSEIQALENIIKGFVRGFVLTHVGETVVKNILISKNILVGNGVMTSVVRSQGTNVGYSNINIDGNISSDIATYLSDGTSPAPIPLVSNFFNKGVASRGATIPAATGTDAAVINAVITDLRNLGIIR